jgi:hypothetical protein
MKVRVLEYFGYKGARNYTFLSGPYESIAGIKGRKRVNPIKLFTKTKLRKRDPDDKYLKPDKEYNFDIPNGRLGNTDFEI